LWRVYSVEWANILGRAHRRYVERAAMSDSVPHIPVLLEAVELYAAVRPGQVWIDCTLGFAGHAAALLAAGAQVYGIDQDADARHMAAERLKEFGDQLTLIPGNFGDLSNLMAAHNVGPVDGILADIGVSSFQLDQAHRGFSFREAGPVDMRMDQSQGETAQEMISRLGVGELAGILRTFGEEPFAGPVARAIKQWGDSTGPLNTATLARAISDAIPMKVKKKRNHHPATRSFQALRIAVNDELGALERLLDAAPECVAPGGRVLIITFHSLEDRIVKRRFNKWAGRDYQPVRRGLPMPLNERPDFELVSRRAIKANDDECARNPRSRSARLRVAQKLEAA
jgi:16S rRNA (cytosine1402-N4)-methyltransferase